MEKNLSEIENYVKVSVLQSSGYSSFLKKLPNLKKNRGKVELDDFVGLVSTQLPGLINEFQFQGTYVFLKNLEELNIIVLPKTKKHWKSHYKISLPYWIKIGSQLKPRKEKANQPWKKYPWLPQLRWASGLGGNLTIKTFESLIIMNNFISEASHSEFIGEKERSVKLFGDEKRLGSLRRRFKSYCDLFNLTNSYRTLKPIVRYDFDNSLSPNGIIVENEDTFTSVLSTNKELETPYYKSVIYGEGFNIWDKYENLFNSNVKKYVYFGDIDKSGFHIFQVLKDKVEEYAKFEEFDTIELILENFLYSNLLIEYQQQEYKFKSRKQNHSIQYNELGIDNTEIISEIIENGLRIPQELLSCIELRKILEMKAINNV